MATSIRPSSLYTAFFLFLNITPSFSLDAIVQLSSVQHPRARSSPRILEGFNATDAPQDRSNGSNTSSNRLQITLPNDQNLNLRLEKGGDCLSPFAHRECWELLQMNEWLTEWRQQIPICQSENPEEVARCVHPDEPWTVAFLRMYYAADPAPDCYTIKENDCDKDPYMIQPQSDSPLLNYRYEYGRYAIMGIGRFFNGYFQSITTHMIKASDLIQPIVDKVNPPRTTKLILSILTQLVSFGLMFVPGGAELSKAFTAFSEHFFDNIKHGVEITNSLAQTIFPKSTKDTRTVQIDELINQWDKPGGTIDSVQGVLGDTLQTVQGRNASDGIAPFLAFAGKGDFAVKPQDMPVPLIADLKANMFLSQAFLTYLTSIALWKNNWKTLAIPGLDMQGVQLGNASCPSWAPKCKDDNIHWCSSYDKKGFCKGKYWWRSEEHDTMYTIVQDEKLGDPEKTTIDIIQSILGNEWTTGQMLFENAAVCEYLTLFPNTSHAFYVPRSNSSAAGFAYLPPFPDMDKYAKDFNSTHKFVPINGEAFVQLAKRPDYDKKFDRPDRGATPFGIVPDGQEDIAQGIDVKCISQMRTIVATAWKHKNWRKGSGKA